MQKNFFRILVFCLITTVALSLLTTAFILFWKGAYWSIFLGIFFAVTGAGLIIWEADSSEEICVFVDHLIDK